MEAAGWGRGENRERSRGCPSSLAGVTGAVTSRGGLALKKARHAQPTDGPTHKGAHRGDGEQAGENHEGTFIPL